jgi:hypothetical protein
MDTNSLPSLRTKLVFWLFLGVLSVAIAEVSVASSPFAFINPFETAFLVLFYGSHLLVFAWLAFRKGWPTISALWLGGVLFGLYEFYITKVLWAPPWGDTISMAHVDVIAVIVLVFFWHPFMAFIFPLTIGETVGTTSRWVRKQLPTWLTGASPRRVRWALGGIAATHGLLTGSPAVALISTASAVGAAFVAGWWWRRGDRHASWSLRELLPNDRQGKRIALLLAAQYALFTPLWNTASIPPLLGHVVVWLLYAGFALLFRSALKESDAAMPGGQPPFGFWPRRRLLRWFAALLVVTALSAFGPPEIGAVVVWLGASVAGVRMLSGTIRRAVRKPVPTETLPAGRDVDPTHT